MQNLKFYNSPIFFIFKYNYLQLNTSLTEKVTIFPGIFTFPHTISLSNTKKVGDARTHFCWLGITKHSAQPRGDCLPPEPPCSDRRGIQREITNAPYIRAGAYAPLHGFACNANPPSDAGWLRSSPVGVAEPFRSVYRNVSGKLPSPAFAAHTCAPRLCRGCCWLAALCLGVLQQPLKRCSRLKPIL